jgi:hypothetical protein
MGGRQTARIDDLLPGLLPAFGFVDSFDNGFSGTSPGFLQGNETSAHCVSCSFTGHIKVLFDTWLARGGRHQGKVYTAMPSGRPIEMPSHD